jgi:ABC-type lipoprotein export system ATPase subunit
MLRLNRVVKHYLVGGETVKAVDGVSLHIDAGEMVALLGPSGSGKSTLIDLIAGFQPLDAGTITVAGCDVASLKGRKHADYLRLTLGIIGQDDDALTPSATARNNACLKLLREHPKDAPRLIEPLLVDLGLSERMEQPFRKLSKGERQRVMIAQALATNPRLVLADEPTGNLDTSRSKEVLGLIRDRCRDRGTAVLLVTHDPRAIEFADRAYELRDGHLHDHQPDELYERAAHAPGAP